ncbi:MAG: TolC family protein [Bacteroidia bacterium]|nr:TolC family protein [Bacteroidia bacterium]MCZ2277844.1 TolC family protein [Bacteroidia bacterium]
MKIITLIFLLLNLLVSSQSLAQQKWSLQECIEFALKNNLSVAQGEINISIAEATKQQNIFSFFPSLNGSASYNSNTGRSVNAYTNTFTTNKNQSASFSISTGLTLFSGLQLQNQLRQSNLNYLSSKYELAKIKNDISLNIAASYLQAIYAKEEAKNAADRKSLAAQQLAKTKKLVENDLLPYGSQLEAEAQVSNEEFTRISALNSYENALLALFQLLNLDSITAFDIEEPEMSIPRQENIVLTPEAIFKDALTRQPEIKSAALKTEIARFGLKIAAGSRLPKISVYGSLSTMYSDQSLRAKGSPTFLGYLPNGQQTSSGDAVLMPSYQYDFEKTPFNDQLNNNLYQSVGISMNIPLFNGRSNEMNIKRSRLNYESSKLSYKQTENQLYQNIQQAHSDVLAALNKYEAAKKSVASQQEAMSYTEKKYEAGLVTALDYNTARNNLTRAQSSMLQSKFEFIFKLKILDFYAGKPLSY